MHIQLHSDQSTDGSHLMAEHLQAVLAKAMGRFGERISRVEAHLSDADGPTRSSPGDIHCTLEARLIGLDAVVVKNRADNAHEAIDGAVRTLKRAVGAMMSKHDPRRQLTYPQPEETAAPDDLLSAAPATADAVPMRPPLTTTTGLHGTIKLKRLSAARYP